jgi:hypothetical protein
VRVRSVLTGEDVLDRALDALPYEVEKDAASRIDGELLGLDQFRRRLADRSDVELHGESTRLDDSFSHARESSPS